MTQPVRRYFHTRCEIECDPQFGYGKDTSRKLYEIVIGHEGRKILATQRQMEGDSRKYTIVPGFIENYMQETNENGIPVSEISIIPRELREEVSRHVRTRGLEGNIGFWI